LESPRRPLRIATYNVHSCVGRDGRRDPERVSRVIAELDADVVAIQEFTYPMDVAIETRKLASLPALEEYECALGPTLERRSNRFGNLVLTRHPIRELQRIDLSMDRREPRGALAVTIDVEGVELHVLATHLGLKLRERELQVRRILEHVDAMGAASVVVMGDFNDWLPGRSVVHVLDERFGPMPKPRTFPCAWPMLPLDRIWVQPAGALITMSAHASPLARRASDHLPMVAVLERMSVTIAAKKGPESEEDATPGAREARSAALGRTGGSALRPPG
jgi:endonuclease/exonuclease/phosphatase family metal-dependent hydrolase